ncbi:MAG: hypothetical protein H7203_07315 [Rhizobacter sp.]|nr:hypothetical protein [Burkholderiales bacterium]
MNWRKKEALARKIDVRFERDMQDWPLEVSDPERLTEFLGHYDRESDHEFRELIAELIVFSIDEALFLLSTLSGEVLTRAASVLINHPKVVEYWVCPSANHSDEMFAITPWIRELART